MSVSGSGPGSVAGGVELQYLLLLISVVLASCFTATLIALCIIRARLPRTYQYCTPCAGQLGVWPVARPWVEVINNVQGPVHMNRNLVTLPVQGRGAGNLGNSATFQRLGMKTSQRGIPSLEVSHLETKPMSPFDIEENIEDDNQKSELKKTRQGEETKFQRVKKVLSPTSAEVLARRDSVRSKVGSQRLSRKTLKFQSPNDISNVNGSPDADPNVLLSVPQEARRSGRHRVELGNDCVSWSRVGVSCKSENEEIARTVVKKPRDQNHRMERKDKDFQHLSHISEKPSEVSVDAYSASANMCNRNGQGFDNPGYESQSVHSDNSRVRESVISPVRRSSVIREPGSQGSSQGERASVISPAHKGSNHLGYSATSA